MRFRPWMRPRARCCASRYKSALTSLSDRVREVLELRFGLKDGKDHTLEEVSRFFEVTRERIRQIEAKALRKLRHPSRSRQLRDYLGLSENGHDTSCPFFMCGNMGCFTQYDQYHHFCEK